LFSKKGQIFSFDALLTQVDLLNTINDSERRYIAKVKGNQEELLDKSKEIIAFLDARTDSYKNNIYTI